MSLPLLHRLPVLLLAGVAVAPALVVAPAALQDAPKAHPVAPRLAVVPLTGVDAPALKDLQVPSVRPETGGPGRPRATSGPLSGLTRRPARPSVLTPARATQRFSTLGVSWDLTDQTADLAIQVRTRSGGRWGGWTTMDGPDGAATLAQARAEAPPGAKASAQVRGLRAGTEPLWAPDSDGVQVRVDLRSGRLPAGLRVDLIDPGRSDFDGQVGRTPPGSAAASAGRPLVYSRANWGADETRRNGGPDYTATIRAGVIHHTVDRNDYTAAQVPSVIRGDYAYHVSRGWSDIGYNFLVDRFGRIWEGRAGGIDRPVLGAHSGGFNTSTFGVSVLGNYESAKPAPAVSAALARLLAWKLAPYHRDPLGTVRLTSAGGGTARWPSGTTVTVPVIMGHRDVGQTACPGRNLYALIPAIRREVVRLMQAAILEPSVAPAAADAGRGGFTAAGTALTAQTQRLRVSNCSNALVADLNNRVAARKRFAISWNGSAGRTPARPGTYSYRLDAAAGANRYALPVAGFFTVRPPAPGPAGTGPSGAGQQGGYVPLNPVQLLDTRTGRVPALGGGGRTDLQVTGVGGVPSTRVSAVTLALTLLCPSQDAVLTAWPAGQGKPTATGLTVPAHGLRDGLVTVPVGAGGRVSLGLSAGVSDVLAAVVGYQSPVPPQRYLAVPPTTVYDTATAGGPIRNGTSRSIALPTLAGLSGYRMVAVAAYVTSRGVRGNGAVSIASYQAAVPPVGAVRQTAGVGMTAFALLRPAQGRLTLRSSGGDTNVSIQVVGIWTADPSGRARQVSLQPATVYRSDADRAGALRPGVARTVRLAGVGGVPSDATAAVLKLRLLHPTRYTGLLVAPAGSGAGALALRARTGETFTGSAVVPLGSDGRITLTSTEGLTHVSVDVEGYLR